MNSSAIPSNQLIQIGARKRAASSLLFLFAGLWRFRNRLRRATPNRVLILEPVGLGDMVGFNPLVRELLARQYEVLICSKPQWRPLFPDCPGQSWLDIRLPWTYYSSTKVKYDIRSILGEPTGGDLRKLRNCLPGGVGIDTRGDIRSVLLLYWAGCRRVISLSNYLGSNLDMWPISAEVIPFDNNIRRWELNARFLRAIDPTINVSLITPPRLDHLIAKQPNRRVALMPIAPWAGKFWPRERWIALSAKLREQGWDVAGFCGPGQRVASAEQLGPDIPLVECETLQNWADEFNRCSFVITVDSGPMHLADAMDIPVIGLFGVGKLPLWAPSGKRSIVLSHQDASDFHVCHPVDENVPIAQKFMNRITVEEVLGAANRVATPS